MRNWSTLSLTLVIDWTNISLEDFLVGWENQWSNFHPSVVWFQPVTAVITGRSISEIHSVLCLCLLWSNMRPHRHTERGSLVLFSFHRAYFTSPLPLRVPRQQPLLVYLCVFALWFSSEQHNPSPSGGWLSGLFIQSSMKQRLAFCMSRVPCVCASSCRRLHSFSPCAVITDS